MAKQHDVLVRMLLIGDSGVGKTCLICRFADDRFYTAHGSTIGIDFKIKSATVNGRKVRIQVWDTAGQERYETITKQYYRRAQGIVLVYDMTNEKSFQSLQKWIGFIRDYADEDAIIMLVASKCDMEGKRKVEKERGQLFAKQMDIEWFYETSAKESNNIEKAFLHLASEVMKRHKSQFDSIQLEREDSDAGEFVSELVRDPKYQGSSCCAT